MSTARTIHQGAIVRSHDTPHYPKGVVVSEIGRAYVVIQWPSGLYTKEHQSELRRVVA